MVKFEGIHKLWASPPRSKVIGKDDRLKSDGETGTCGHHVGNAQGFQGFDGFLFEAQIEVAKRNDVGIRCHSCESEKKCHC